jgi:hypothetical protein
MQSGKVKAEIQLHMKVVLVLVAIVTVIAILQEFIGG